MGPGRVDHPGVRQRVLTSRQGRTHVVRDSLLQAEPGRFATGAYYRVALCGSLAAMVTTDDPGTGDWPRSPAPLAAEDAARVDCGRCAHRYATWEKRQGPRPANVSGTH